MTQKDRVKALCKEKGVSIHKLETDLKFGNGYISQLKKGFPADRLSKIADYFGVSLDYLSGNTEEKTPFPVDEYVYGFLKEAAKQEGKNGSGIIPQSGLSKRTLNIMALLSNLSEDGLTEVENFVEFQLNKNQNNPSDTQKDSHKTEQPGIYVRKKN